MENSDMIQLRVLGLSYAKLKRSAYMLILRQTDGPLHLNIWIGEAEAQSIAIAMEGIKPPRPLVHDIFNSFIHAFGVRLEQVFIYNVENDVFYSELTFTDGERVVKIDSRTSDGIAIAMRTGAPIYTTPAILKEHGFLLEVHEKTQDDGETPESLSDLFDTAGTPGQDDQQEEATTRVGNLVPRPEQLSIPELERLLEQLIDNEDYEEAARITEILKRKKG